MSLLLLFCLKSQQANEVFKFEQCFVIKVEFEKKSSYCRPTLSFPNVETLMALGFIVMAKLKFPKISFCRFL